MKALLRGIGYVLLWCGLDLAAHLIGLSSFRILAVDERTTAQYYPETPTEQAKDVYSQPKCSVYQARLDGDDSEQLPTDVPASMPMANAHRQQHVVEAFQHAWTGYRQHAWGKDMLKPISHGHEEWFGLGLTIVDSLDTMLLMGLDAEFDEAREWVSTHLDVRKDTDVNLFEATIRVLGGLLGAYHLSEDDLFKDKAIQLADSLIPAFSSASGVPFSDVNLFQGNASPPKWAPESSIAEVTTLQMEFREVSRLSGDPKYQDAVDRVMNHVQAQPLRDGLVHTLINPNSGVFKEGKLTLGARADSYYEYLLKQWLQSNRTEERFIGWYRTSIDGIEKHLMRSSTPSDLLFVGEQQPGGQFSPKMDHLVCFLPGLLALGSLHGSDAPDRTGYHMQLARKLMHTCYQMYRTMPTGLSAELVYFGLEEPQDAGGEIMVKDSDRHNLLRPEAVESLFILYRITGDRVYQDWGWEMFSAFEKYCKVDGGGYTSIGDVISVDDTKPRDRMESFFLAETLKYFYLLFGENQTVLPLNEYVFNTEAHPLPIWGPEDT